MFFPASSEALNASIIEEIKVANLKIDGNAPTIENVSYVASYNWVDGQSPIILVPGSPPAWTPPRGRCRLKPDHGDAFRDLNAARYPSFPMEPAVRSLLAMQPGFDIQALHIVGCGNTFGNLLRSAGSQCRPFRFDVDVVAGAVFLLRKEKSAQELITDLRGYGHTFPEKYTTWDTEVRNSCSHQRLVRYEFGSLRCLVRSETDGYVKESRVMSPAKVEESTAPAPLEDTFSTLAVQVVGRVVSQDQIFDIKTRRSRAVMDMDEIFPRLWVNQTPKFLIAYHEFGVFEKHEEKGNATLLSRFYALLKRIVEVMTASETKQLEVSWEGEGAIRIAKLNRAGRRALPSALLQRFDEHV
ncbi:hypothetical protein B0J14DRAFT_630366 [Halenospora varia]|nr:hypothetical protein B0J14DRAFT_630366 [Halenospora varia]